MPDPGKPSVADGAFAAPRSAGWQGGFSALPAWAAEVVSSNIVGYQKLALSDGLNLVAAPFVAVGGSNPDINETMTSDSLKTGTVAQFWNAGSYNTIYYYDVDSEGGVYTDDSYEDCLGPGWGDIDQVVVAQNMNGGEGFWIQSYGAATNVFSGEVSTNMVSLTLSDGLNLVGNPFPAGISIQNVKSSSLKTGTVAQFWNGSSYATVYYYDEDSEGGVYTDDSYEDCLGPGWGDIDQISVNHNVKSAEGFWIQSYGSASATIEF